MKKYIIAFIVLTATLTLEAVGQETKSLSDTYSARYDLLVSKLGPSGVGIENLLGNWEKEDPVNLKMLKAKFSYYFDKSSSVSIVSKSQKRFLGNDPVLQLRDSTGADVNYFQETFYDDSLFSMSLKALDKAMTVSPSSLDVRFLKANALAAYEKESPDMVCVFLEELVDEYYSRRHEWTFPDVENVDDEFFRNAMQEYCYTFYSIGSEHSLEAFRNLSQKMLSENPKDIVFLSNIGSYYLVGKQDIKKALKYYNTVLKIQPDDYTAIKNCVLLSRKCRNVKLEKKYLPMLAKYGTESEKAAAQARLDALNAM